MHTHTECMRTCTRTCTQARTHARAMHMVKHAHTHTHAYIAHTYTDMHMHKHVYTHTRTDMHAHKHTHARARVRVRSALYLFLFKQLRNSLSFFISLGDNKPGLYSSSVFCLRQFGCLISSLVYRLLSQLTHCFTCKNVKILSKNL